MASSEDITGGMLLRRVPQQHLTQAGSQRRASPDGAAHTAPHRKIPFLAIALPIIAIATFGQMKTLGRLAAYFPSVAETRLAALPAGEVVQRELPPPPGAATPIRASRTLFVRRGDTLQQLLAAGGVSWAQAGQVVTAIKGFYDPRKLRIGQKLDVTLDAVKSGSQAAGGTPRAKPGWELSGLVLQAGVDRDVVARRLPGGGFSGGEVVRPLTRDPVLAQGRITSSLFVAAAAAGMPAGTIAELIRLFSYDVDFQRDIQPDDRFEVLYERELTAEGEVARAGPIRYASLILSGEKKELFRHSPSGATDAEYFNRFGHGITKALMKTPIDGALLTSSFGMRKHPILGYTRMHKGVDFAAAKGTPVMAAGSGVIETSGWNGNFGKYVRIRHNGQYQTAYAHLAGFAKGIGKGAQVRQGQIIGFSGSTGRSTGPHLHYEVLQGGVQVNPQKMKLPTARELKGAMLADFKKQRDGLDKERLALSGRPTGIASLR